MPQLATLAHTHAVHLHSDSRHPFADAILFSDRMDFHLGGRMMRQEIMLVVYDLSHVSAALFPPPRARCIYPTVADALAPFAVAVRPDLPPLAASCRLWVLFTPSRPPWPLVPCPRATRPATPVVDLQRASTRANAVAATLAIGRIGVADPLGLTLVLATAASVLCWITAASTHSTLVGTLAPGTQRRHQYR